MSKIKKAFLLLIPILAVITICGGFLFFWPSSSFYSGFCMRGTMQVTVEGVTVTPQNITVSHSSGDYEKCRVRSGEDGITVSCKAYLHDGYTYSYDVETEDGTKHLMFTVMKFHAGGPAKEFYYSVNLNQEDDQWIAEVFLTQKDAEGQVQRISLDENENAYVELSD